MPKAKNQNCWVDSNNISHESLGLEVLSIAEIRPLFVSKSSPQRVPKPVVKGEILIIIREWGYIYTIEFCTVDYITV